MFILFAFLLCGGSFAVFAQDSGSSSHSIFNDFDQDGLSNEEEIRYGTDSYKMDTDGDGYSDSTEIRSGYDPLKPAPGDKIIRDTAPASAKIQQPNGNKQKLAASSEDLQQEGNMTQQAIGRIQTVLESEEVKSSQDMINAFQESIQTMISESDQTIELPEVDIDSIRIKKQNYDKLDEAERNEKMQKDSEEYLSAILYIFTANMPHGLVPNFQTEEEFNSAADPVIEKAMQSFSTGNYQYINEISTAGEHILEQMREVEVPKNMLETHVKGMQLAQYALQLKDDVKPDASDPIKSIIKMSKVQVFLQLIDEYLSSSEKVFGTLNIQNVPYPGEDK